MSKPILYNKIFGKYREVVLRHPGDGTEVYTRERFLEAMKRESPAMKFRIMDEDPRVEKSIYVLVTGVQIHPDTTKKLIVTGFGKFEHDAAVGQPVRFVYDTSQNISNGVRQHWAANGYMSPFQYEAYVAAYMVANVVDKLALHGQRLEERLKDLRARLPF